MNRIQQIAKEIIQLYGQQLNVWTLGKVRKLKGADILRYDRRRNRIKQLRRELEGMIKVGG